MSVFAAGSETIRFDQRLPWLQRTVLQSRMLLWRWKWSRRAAQQMVEPVTDSRSVLVSPSKILHDASVVLPDVDSPVIIGGNWDLRVQPLPTVAEPSLIGTDSTEKLTPQNDWPEVSLAIGRHGTLSALTNGATVTKARSLGIPQIRARVMVRHPQWVDACKQFLCFAKSQRGGTAYQPCTHIDLEHLPSAWSANRFQIIQQCLSNSDGGRLMDIGSNLGYFCHRAEEMGYECVAIEHSLRIAYFTEMLRQAENRRFQVIFDSVLDYPFTESYEVVLALNIFHHFLKTPERYRQLEAMLSRMRTRELIFQAHRTTEEQMLTAYRNYPADEFVQFISQHSGLKKVEYLGTDQDRPIFRLRAA